jgi:hypothetical protein
MNALALRPSTDEDAQALIRVLNEERRLSAAELMPRIGIFPEKVGSLSAIVKLMHIARRANRLIDGMGYSIGSFGNGLDAIYGISRHDRFS